MTFDEVLEQVRELLQSKGRVAYRTLKRRFELDDEYLEDLKAELIDAEQVAVDEDSKVLVWIGKGINGEKDKRGKGEDSLESSVQRLESKDQSLAPSPQHPTVVSSQLSVASSPQPPAPQTPNLELRTHAPSPQTLDSRPRDPRLDAAERRQLTVMFCDLVGSTALSIQLDPEELREVVRTYQETCTEVIRRYDGHVAQHLGDGLLVYFGYPLAHEDDAVRAVHAGLEIVGAIRGQVAGDGGQVKREPLHVRIGVHTGLVVIGEIGSSEKREMLALGETPNIAARVQGIANPDEVVISATTYHLVEGLFECENRGQPTLKGVATPLTLYRVIKEGEAHSRFEVVVRKGLTPLVGRDHEFGLLHERWERVKDGAGQVVLLSGEPGIGKSRLVEALKEMVEHEGARCLELRCSPYAQNSAFYPVIEYLQRVLQFNRDDSSEQKLDKLEQVLSRSRLDLPEAVPLFASLLSLPAPRYTPPAFSPQKQKEKTYEAIVAWFCEEAKRQAVMYAWEDLHWADPSTLELLTLFLAQVPTTRLLAVLTFRPEFTSPWGSHSYLSQLTLSRLGRAHVETIVEKVSGGTALPVEIIRQIVRKTDGVPLFVEELTKTVLESIEFVGSVESIGSTIPATLHDSLMARLDRLGAAKEIAQLGATLGREFDYTLLHAVSPLHEETLQQGLRQLVETELVYQSGRPPQAQYLFKHALVQDTAYQSLLKSRRQQLHNQVAQVLGEKFPQTVETQPELIAHHYTEAGLIAQAIPYWQKAGERATQCSAHAEAINHLTKGLELLKTLPDTPEHVQQELTLQIALGFALQAIKGYGAPEVGKAYTRARELCQQIGETPQLFPVLGGLWVFYEHRTDFKTMHDLAEQSLRLAQRVQDSYLLVWAHRFIGETLRLLGELVLARVHLEQGIAFYDPQQHRTLAFATGVDDPGAGSLSEVAFALWLLGYPDQALRRLHRALTLAQEVFHPLTLTCALGYAAVLHQFRRERQAARERAEATVTLSNEQGFPFWTAWGGILQGWALAEQGQGEEGVAHIRQGLATGRTTGSELSRPHFLALLAEGCGKAGQAEEGLRALAEALATVDKTGERWYEAELYRLRGELTLQEASQKSKGKSQKSKVETNPQLLAPNPQREVEREAEGYFLKAIDIAQKQQAKSLELRAAISLVRLRQQQMAQAISRATQHETRSRLDEAHIMLSDIYNWFTEGFDTKDLQEAKALIEELSH